MGSVAAGTGRIGVEERGSGPATPIVFLHGVGSTKRVWAPQLAHFGAARPALAFDYPGYGDSDPARDGATRDDFAAAILAAMDTLRIERAHVCGLSLGGVVAIAMHHAAPARCASLILADTFAVHPDGPGIRERGLGASRSVGMRAMAQARAAVLLAPGASPALHDEVVDTMASIDPAAFAVGLDAVWLADQRARAAAVDVPTLVLCGTEDTVTPPALSEDLAALIPASELALIAGAGHLANIEKPCAFNAAIDAFLLRIGDKT